MDSTTLIVVIAVVVVVVAVVVFQRVSWGSFPGETRLPTSIPLAQLDAAGDAEVRALLAGGNKIAAIKRVRELTGMGLKDAKDYVEALPPGAIQTVSDTPRTMSGDAAADPEVRALLAGGNKIAAIKRVRELTGMGLKEAKDYVEALERIG